MSPDTEAIWEAYNDALEQVGYANLVADRLEEEAKHNG